MDKTQEQINQSKIEELEKSENIAKIEEEKELFFDFDKAIEEKGKKPLQVRFQNICFDVPHDMPFDFSMFFFRKCLRKENGKQVFDVKEEDIVEFITLMFRRALALNSKQL